MNAKQSKKFKKTVRLFSLEVLNGFFEGMTIREFVRSCFSKKYRFKLFLKSLNRTLIVKRIDDEIKRMAVIGSK